MQLLHLNLNVGEHQQFGVQRGSDVPARPGGARLPASERKGRKKVAGGCR